MTKKKKNTPLDDAMGQLYGNPQSQEEVTDMDDLAMRNMETSVDDLDKNNKPDDTGVSTEDEDKNAHDDDSEIPEDVLNNIDHNSNSNDEEDGEEEVDDADDANEVHPGEAQQIGAFFDAFAEALHWDVDDNDKPQTIESLVEYIEDVVE
jgi:hypothetical protein